MSKRGGFPGMGGFGGMDMGQLMKEAKEMQTEMQKTQEELAIKEFEAAVKENAKNKEELYNKAISLVDKAWSKGVLAKNTASRKKSSLAKLLNK